MARNAEKAQSTLYRFREAQASDLGLSSKRAGGGRPKMVSSVTSLRECEKWHGLTDYEIRDLNDELNQLFREKENWERHIVALGGANYRSVAPRMIDDEGNEIAGLHGYRYFGRAKDLPGVRELFERSKQQEAEAKSYRADRYRRFQNQTGAYYGNDDEKDGSLLAEESASESLGWTQGWQRVARDLGAAGAEPPAMPRPPPTPLDFDGRPTAPGMEPPAGAAPGQRAMMHNDTPEEADELVEAVAPLFPALDPQELVMPRVPTRQDIETHLLRVKKEALRSEYVAE
ncbi:NineTeen Complex (NTC) component [Malassezia sp. CBS 17886]|nr:NineTeen Complex (NTC) component [Malassezia sp. CBS 17886]